MKDSPWKLLKREEVFASKFVSVYKDTLEIHNGKIIDDYYVVKKHDYIIIVATDEEGKLIVLNEFKYGAGKFMFGLPAGHIEKNMSSLDAAKKELLEETGYGEGTFEEIGPYYEAPTKDLNTLYLVRAKNVTKISEPHLENSELLTVQLLTIDDVKKQIKEQKWQASFAISALALAGLLF